MEIKRLLAIDDCRELPDAHVLCRTFDDGIKALDFLGPWDELWLDHDLGALMTSNGDGCKVVEWLNEHKEKYPDTIIVITGSPAGFDRIVGALRDGGVMEQHINRHSLWTKKII